MYKAVKEDKVDLMFYDISSDQNPLTVSIDPSIGQYHDELYIVPLFFAAQNPNTIKTSLTYPPVGIFPYKPQNP